MWSDTEEVALEVALPDAERQAWLLSGLARLIGLRGYETFVLAPILLASDAYFPDPWEPGPHGVRTLLRRLLAYAGLGHFEVKLHVYREANARMFDTHGVGHGGPGAEAWFAGIEEDRCVFGVNARALRDVDALVGTLGHEVAHAYRHHHGVRVPSRDTEELLTDLTAVYLGFGVFLLNSSSTFKTGGYTETGDQLLFEKSTRGYLAPGDLAVLLGAQVTARGLLEPERRAVFAALSPNQEQLVRDACQNFSRDVEALATELGIPPRSAWPTPPPLAELTRPLPPGGDDDGLMEIEPSAAAPERPPRAIRVVESSPGLYAALGGVSPLFLAGWVLEGWALLGSMIGVSAAGWVLGATRARAVCSACRSRQSKFGESCEGCGAHFVETVRSEHERLDAEERLAEEDTGDDGADIYESEEERAENQLLNVLFVRWAVDRGLVDATGALTPDGQEFSRYYFEGEEPRFWTDYRMLTTATRIRETEATFQRFAAVLERRHAEFLSRDP